MIIKKQFQKLYKNQKCIRALGIGLTFLMLLGLFIVFVPPSHIGIILLFHFLLFFALFFLISAFTNRTFHGIIISGGIVLYFFLRYLELRHILYPSLIIATIISLELYIRKQ